MKPPVTFNTGNVEWYTPPDIVHAVHQTLGHVDLDPASSSTANETIKAKKFFTAADDSLNRPWFGRIYLNPPYARGVVKKFVSKLIYEFNTGHVKSAVILVNAQTDAKWFNSLAQACTGAIFTLGRIRFLQANGTLSKNTPTLGQCIFYLGYDVEKFFAAFAPFGYPVFFGKKIT